MVLVREYKKSITLWLFVNPNVPWLISFLSGFKFYGQANIELETVPVVEVFVMELFILLEGIL